MAGRGGLALRLDLPYLMADTDRHGNERLFVRRFGRECRIRAKPGTTDFTKLYNDALDALESCAPLRQAPRWRAGRHARVAGGDLFRGHRIHRPADVVAIHPPRDHRGVPPRADQADLAG